MPAIGVLLVALCTAWAALQPLRSQNAADHALDLAAAHRYKDAVAEAARAHRIDPASISTLWVKAAVAIDAGQKPAAQTYFQEAVFDQPSNPEAWTRLAEFELYRMNNPNQALAIVSGALFLDPHSAPAQTVFFDARLAQRGGA